MSRPVKSLDSQHSEHHSEPLLSSHQSISPPRRSAPPRSRYTNVDVLLLQWEEDDLGVNKEIRALEQVLRSGCNFSTQLKYIPSINSEDELIDDIKVFRRGKSTNDLLILYYGGHADGDPRTCIWRANNSPESPTLNWDNVQNLLLGSPAHVLIILDCCFSGLAAKDYAVGVNWLLGSSAKESFATGVAWNSFTSALTEEIYKCANRWRTQNEGISLDTVHSNIIHRNRDLHNTPTLVRLTDHDCDRIDLTPLSKPFEKPQLQASSTDPVAMSPASFKTAQARPPSKQMTLPINSMGPRPDPLEFHENHALLIELARGESQTVRLSNLPQSTDHHDIKCWFIERLSGGSSQERLISRIGPITGSQGEGMITFVSIAVTKQALEIQDMLFKARASGCERRVVIDKYFQGLTCIYSSLQSPDKQPTFDVVFVHGANGHAINDFARHYANPWKEYLWPCEALSKALEAVGIFPRIMTFGWATDAWFSSFQNVDCDNFVQALKFERWGSPKRPLVFVGHGLGGLLIKQAVAQIINTNPQLDNPVKHCFFFAVPHHEPKHGAGFASVLANMHSVLQGGGPRHESLVSILKLRNTLISSISNEFDQIRKEHSIGTTSFCEGQETRGFFIVPRECAMLDNEPGKSHIVDANYRDIVRFSDGDSNLQPILNIMCKSLKKPIDPGKTVPLPAPKPDPEKIYPLLKKYDTVFLVDDSESMFGRRWETTSRVLAKIASIAVKYDNDGVDIRFFNNYLKDEERLHLDTAEKVMNLFKKVNPEGPTPTADVLDEELENYVFEFEKDRHIKGLNLIIITDGEPDKDQDVEGIIVKFANKLKEIRAPALKVGVQFVQVGGDSEATKFLQRLDDKLMKKHGLDRDMIDTVLWEEGAEDSLDEKILLGGVLKRLDKQQQPRQI